MGTRWGALGVRTRRGDIGRDRSFASQKMKQRAHGGELSAHRDDVQAAVVERAQPFAQVQRGNRGWRGRRAVGRRKIIGELPEVGRRSCARCAARRSAPQLRQIAFDGRRSSSDMGALKLLRALRARAGKPPHGAACGRAADSPELRQQIESNIGGLIIGRVRAGNVGAQRTHRSLARETRRGVSPSARAPPRRVPRQDPWRWIRRSLRRPKSAPRKKCSARPQLQRRIQQRGAVDIGVAMHLAVAQKLGVLQARNHAQDALLLAEAHVILKSHQVVTAGAGILLREAAPPRKAGGRCADRSAPWASWDRSAACRGRGERSPRSAGRLRNSGS